MRKLLLYVILATPAYSLDFADPRALAAQALETNPTLIRLRANVAAARERIEPADALPNPMLMAGIRDKQVDLRDDEMMTMYMVGASQTLVRPDKRAGRRAVAELAVRSAERELDSVRAEIERDVRLAWYELASADMQLKTIADLREMIDAVVAAARVRYEVGTSAQSDVIRAQLQQSDLDLERLRLQARRRSAAARLLSLLDLPFTTEVPPLVMPENTDDVAIGATTTPPPDHPALASLETDVARAEAEIRLVRADERPDLDLEAQYGFRPMQTDMFSVTARIQLPLRNRQIVEPRIREAMLRRDAARARIDETRRALASAMAQAVVAHEEATRQLEFHASVLVPQAHLAFESTLAAYQTGKAPFDAILTTETAYHRLRLQYFDFLAAHAQAVVNYEALRAGARSGIAISTPSSSSGSTSSASSSSMGTMP
jgi:cobalt-zinc-cadmium efflux system outer membrane protein